MKTFLLVPEEDLEFLFSLLQDYDVAFNIGQKNLKQLRKMQEKSYKKVEHPF